MMIGKSSMGITLSWFTVAVAEMYMNKILGNCCTQYLMKLTLFF